MEESGALAEGRVKLSIRGSTYEVRHLEKTSLTEGPGYLVISLEINLFIVSVGELHLPLKN